MIHPAPFASRPSRRPSSGTAAATSRSLRARALDDVFAFQLAVYAAAGQGEGIDVRAAYLHELSKSNRREVDVRPAASVMARTRAGALIDGIVKGKFPSRPAKERCKACDVRAICGNAACDKYDF